MKAGQLAIAVFFLPVCLPCVEHLRVSDVQLSCLGIQEIKEVFNCTRKLCRLLSTWRCKDSVKESIHVILEDTL